MRTEKQFSQHRLTDSLVSACCAAALLGACSKSAPPADDSASQAPASTAAASGTAPTGLVKNPVKHTQLADVTQWMDKASTKTAAQLAQEEKLARDKLAQDAAHKAQDQKQLSAKPASNVKETVAVQAPATAPAPVVAKPVDPPAQVAKAPDPVPTAVVAPPKSTEPEKIVFKLLNGAQPKFPNGALRAGYSEGSVSARLHIDADGKVAQVEILKAKPAKFFDKEVIAAVSQWKYAPIAKASTTTVEFSFHLE